MEPIVKTDFPVYNWSYHGLPQCECSEHMELGNIIQCPLLPVFTEVFSVQSVEKVESLREELRKGHAEKENQLREKLAQKDADIDSHIRAISDLQQQLTVSSFIM